MVFAERLIKINAITAISSNATAKPSITGLGLALLGVDEVAVTAAVPVADEFRFTVVRLWLPSGTPPLLLLVSRLVDVPGCTPPELVDGPVLAVGTFCGFPVCV